MDCMITLLYDMLKHPSIGDTLLKHLFPRLYVLEVSKQVSVAEKFTVSVTGSFRRVVRGGAESHQLSLFTNLLDTVILSNLEDRWFFDLNGDGRFCVKDVRCLLDDVFLPKAEVPTQWIKSIPIKINIFAWKVYLDRLPTRVNLAKRNVAVASLLCPLCDSGMEDAAHLFLDAIWRKM
nr:RNA-directed DNA polymerase, eukaryota [Tanacetum cinerariifolium]